MANSRDGSKSQAISEFVAANADAKPRQIVEALKEQGIEVSLGLANKVKYGKPGKKKASARKSKRNVSAKAETGMSMSDSIRQYIAKNRKAGPKDIQAGLKAEGIKVKLGLISAVKYAKPKKGGKKRRSSRAPVVHAAARKIPTAGLSIEQLIEVKRFADSIGGAEQVRQALEMLEQLR